MYDRGTTITCTRPDPLAAGSDYPPISIPVLVGTSVPPGQLSNTATLTAPSDGNPDNNSFTDAGAVSEPAIDLHVEKVVTSTPNFTPVGYLFFLDPVTYRIEVTNNGVADAANVQLTETFEAPLTVESITPSQGSCSGTTCNLGTITAGQAPVTIDVQASAGTGFEDYPSNALLNNTATVSAPVGTEINPGRQQRVGHDLDAAVGGHLDHEGLLARATGRGRPGHLHVDRPQRRARNRGLRGGRPPAGRAAEAPDGDIDLRRDRRLSVRPDRGEHRRPPGPDFPFVVCDIPQFGPGEDRVITIQSTLAPDSAGTQVNNLALSSNTLPFAGVFSFDPDFSNNDDSVTFTPGTVDTAIEKTRVGDGPVAVGAEAAFQLVVSNNGDVPATDVVARDTLPAGLTPLAPPAGCAVEGQDVVCRIDSLPKRRAAELRDPRTGGGGRRRPDADEPSHGGVVGRRRGRRSRPTTRPAPT